MIRWRWGEYFQSSYTPEPRFILYRLSHAADGFPRRRQLSRYLTGGKSLFVPEDIHAGYQRGNDQNERRFLKISEKYQNLFSSRPLI
jgi:hypothetical protein